MEDALTLPYINVQTEGQINKLTSRWARSAEEIVEALGVFLRGARGTELWAASWS